MARELSEVEPINFSAGSIGGTVVDSVTSEPIVGAEVRLLQMDGEPVSGQTAIAYAFAPNGRYGFGNVLPGGYRLRAAFEGYDTVTVVVSRITVGERHVLNFRLPRRK